MSRAAAAALAALLIGVLSGGRQEAHAAAERRFALLIGNNRGDAGEEPLRYAEDDAGKMLAVLTDVGGVAAGDARLVLGADADGVRRALGELEVRLGQARRTDRLIVYVSGHADEGELHLGGTRLPIAELTAFTGRVPVGIALLVVDSCRSGAATRAKGFRPLPGTHVSVEVAQVMGRVILSSSGADESAQESDSIGASFFTHHLLEAMRGAADVSHDGEVTLQEAYAYAYARTVESTFATSAGVQHPTYRVDLQGHGDLVLSDVGRAPSKLTLDVQEPGEWMITSSDGRVVFHRYAKGKGPATLALPAGEYRVQTRRGAAVFAGSVRLAVRGEARLADRDLSRVGAVAVAEKGRRGGRDWQWLVAGGPSVGTGAVRGVSALAGVQLNLVVERAGLLGPFNLLELVVSRRTATAFDHPMFDHAETTAYAGVGLRSGGDRLRLAASARLGGIIIRQTTLPVPARTGLAPAACAAGSAHLRLVGPLAAFAELEAGAALVQKIGGTQAAPSLGGTLGLAIAF